MTMTMHELSKAMGKIDFAMLTTRTDNDGGFDRCGARRRQHPIAGRLAVRNNITGHANRVLRRPQQQRWYVSARRWLAMGAAMPRATASTPSGGGACTVPLAGMRSSPSHQ